MRNAKNPGHGGMTIPGTCDQPTHEIKWCHLKEFQTGQCGADAVLHELAHTCGWKEYEEKGVPGNTGVIQCK